MQGNVCFSWVQSGFCARGVDCRFLHPQQPQQAAGRNPAGAGRWMQQQEAAWQQQHQHTAPMHAPAPQQHSMQMQEPMQQLTQQLYNPALQHQQHTQPFDAATQQSYDPAMQQPFMQQGLPAQQGMYPAEHGMYPAGGMMQQPAMMQQQQQPMPAHMPMQQQPGMQASMAVQQQPQHQQEGGHAFGMHGASPDRPVYGGPAGGPRGPQQDMRGHNPRAGSRHEPPLPEPTEPAYKTRVWHKPLEDAALPTGVKVRIMSYNLLADELAHTHRAELYYHTASDHLMWPRRWSLIKEEIEHLKPDVLCLQEVDHWRQCRDELQELGYEGQYLQRSGGRPDGCATLWRSSRFELVAVNRLNFSEFDLRDNVGLMAVLKHKQAGSGGPGDRQQHRGSRAPRRPGRRSRSGRRVAGSSSESTSSSESESGDSDDGDRAIPVPRVALRAAEEEAAARSSGRVYRRAGGPRGRSTHRDRDESPTGVHKHRSRRSKGMAAAIAAAAEGSASLYGQFLAVANTHVLFNPKRGDVKLAQLRLLVHHLQVLIAAAVPEDQAGHVAALIMGDFNSKPGTPLYTFMRQGWVDCLQHHRKDMAGNISNTQQFYQQQQQQGYNRNSRMLPQHQQARMLQYGVQQQRQTAPMLGLHPSSAGQQGMQLQAQKQQNQALQGMTQLAALAYQQQQRGQLLNQALQGLQHQQQQQQQGQRPTQGRQQGQCQQQRGMVRSASAPALTLRRLKQAGWTAEELITATGGACNTHLRHFLQQHREQQQAELLARQRAQRGLGPDDDSGEEMDLTPDDAASGAAGTAPAWGQQQQQGQPWRQSQGAAAGAGGARGGGGDSGDEMELSDGEGRRQRGQQQQQQLVPPPPPPPPGSMSVPPPPPPPPAAAATQQQQGTGQQQQRQQQRQQGGRQGGGGGRWAGRGGGLQQGRAGTGQGRQGRAASGGEDSEEIEEVPFFLKRAPAHRMDEPLPATVGDGIARHELDLRSCYAEALGSEPEYTSCHDAFWGTVDFIFYTPQEGRALLQPVAVLLPPEPQTHLRRHRCMPNATIPSDHISLVADFVLSVAGRSQPGRAKKQ